ncbi:MAG: hypothetical protein Q8862_00565 [Bacteroidota bacterium]|nr:hypothetical protein [Bacteroidota bacterium]
MYPVYLFDNKEEDNIGINVKEFNDKFLEICQENRDSNRARAFAFILTDFHSTEANHFIMNKEFWIELHTLSDHFLTVFHLDFTSTELHKLFRENKTEYVKSQYNSIFQSLSEVFKADGVYKNKMPSILFFQTDEAKIIDFFFVELNAHDLQQNMKNLKDYIKSAVESVKEVTDENLNNSKEIFQLLKSSVNGTKRKNNCKYIIKKIIQLYRLIKNFELK